MRNDRSREQEERLRDSLSGKASLAMVQYIDYERESVFAGKVSGAVPFLFKRLSFEHEHELRCIMQRKRIDPSLAYDDSEIGKEVEVSLEALIQEVVVSPNSEAWFFSLVKELTLKLGFHFNVRHSKLDAAPAF